MTALTYLDDPERYDSTARVIRVLPQADGELVVVLDQTIFYPQGGGQPTDRGHLATPNGEMDVLKVSFHDGEVLHAGRLRRGQVTVGDAATLHVDAPLRRLHARLHTGGHLVMTVVDRLFGMPALKGYHFPDGPYVEFEGTLPAQRRTTALNEIQCGLDDIVAEDSVVTWNFDTVENLRAAGVHIPAEISAGKPTRVVVTSGYRSPCGGTHIRTLGVLKGLTAKSVKAKAGRTRVSYYFDE